MWWTRVQSSHHLGTGVKAGAPNPPKRLSVRRNYPDNLPGDTLLAVAPHRHRHRAIPDGSNGCSGTGDGQLRRNVQNSDSESRSIINVAFYDHQAKSTTNPSGKSVCAPNKCYMLLTIESPFYEVTSYMELMSPPIFMRLVSSGTPNQCNIRV